MTDDEILDECRKRFAVASDAKIGSVIRIRLPADYTVSPGPGLVYNPMTETKEERDARLWAAVQDYGRI